MGQERKKSIKTQSIQHKREYDENGEKMLEKEKYKTYKNIYFFVESSRVSRVREMQFRVQI